MNATPETVPALAAENPAPAPVAAPAPKLDPYTLRHVAKAARAAAEYSVKAARVMANNGALTSKRRQQAIGKVDGLHKLANILDGLAVEAEQAGAR